MRHVMNGLTVKYAAQTAALLLCMALVAPAIAEIGPAQRLTLSARVWGLLKYHSPAVSSCQRNWDQTLLDALPGLEAAASDLDFNARIAELIAKAGPVPALQPGTSPEWVLQAPLSAVNQAALQAIASQRVAGRCYVRPYYDAALKLQFTQADFANDVGFNAQPLTRGTRLLGAFRFWNAAEYYFAYKSLIGKPWANVLSERILSIGDAASGPAYALAMRQFSAELNDSHGAFNSPHTPTSAAPPFSALVSQGKVIVSARLPQATGVAVGDEVVSVNSAALTAEIARLDAFSFGSNPVFRRAQALGFALAPLQSNTYVFQRADASRYSASFPASAAFESELARGQAPGWRRLPTDSTRSCTVTQVNFGALEARETPALLTSARNSDLLVLDLRQYPNSVDAFVALADALLQAPVVPAAVQTPDYTRPGNYIASPQEELLFGGSAPIGFQGRIQLVLNEQSISFSEFAAMVFQTQPKTRVFGSQTAGADGEITNGLSLPGGISTYFSSNRISYPNGQATQRIGIVPDVQVTPTQAGLRAGRDELVEAASDCRWKSETPSVRRPRAGLYFDPNRNGEGIDFHKFGLNFAGITYFYDDNRYPSWGLSTSTVDGGVWNAALDRVLRNNTPVLPGQNQSVTVQNAGALQLDFQHGPYSAECTLADQSQLGGRATLAWPLNGPNQTLCLQPILLGDVSPLSGLWSGPAPEFGWGISVQHSGDNLVLILYAQDAAGEPRWLIGNVPWTGQTGLSVPMERIRGFCSRCAPRAFTREAAGIIVLNLTNTTPGSYAGNSVDINVSFHDGSVWTRTRMPISKL
jgi:hypothetical protein